jgi:hypothetical protein
VRVEKDFEEFIELLNKHKVQYLIIGAYAMSFHTRPRSTGDIDFFVKSDLENGRKLMRVLRDFGFGSVGLKEDDFLNHETVVQLGFEPNRIDILSSIKGVEFSQAYKTKVRGKFGEQKAWFISFDDLLRNKTSVGRKKDEADAELLREFKRLRKQRSKRGKQARRRR